MPSMKAANAQDQASNTNRSDSSARMKRRKAGMELGQRKEDFELQGFLGRGSYASVYKALSRPSGRQVAIKVIDKQLIAACPGLADRVRYEAETHIGLDHPAIVRLHTFFEDQSRVYFVMDLCEGGELYHYLRKRGEGLPVQEAGRMFRQVVQGVQHLHSQNIAHRDLKLANLLLTDDLQVKISDFGLSVTLAGEAGESGTVCGTPNYMAPEVINRAPHGLSADVWALGCLLYTLLVGCPPFESSTVEATLDRISKVQYEIPSGVSEAACDLIRKMLNKNPSARMSLESILAHDFLQDSTATAAAARYLVSTSVPTSIAHQQTSMERSRARSVSAGASAISVGASAISNGSAWTQDLDHLRAEPAGTPSPHFSSGKALRDRRGIVSRSWDLNGSRPELAASKADIKYGSGNGVHGTGSSTTSMGQWHSAKDEQKDSSHVAENRTTELREHEGSHHSTDGVQTSLQLSLSAIRSSLEQVLPKRPVQYDGSFANTMLSARSHTVATPVHSCRSGADHRARPGEVGKGSARANDEDGNGVARIDAQRMKPHRYDTKHAEIVIDTLGVVFVAPKGSDTVMRVEVGGERVRLHPRRGGGQDGADCEAHAPFGVASVEHGCFALSDLPAKWRRFYAFAAKVIAVIQAKTPKVVYYSPHAKVQLMDDGRGGQTATFVCDFYSGARVSSTPASRGELVLSTSSTCGGRGASQDEGEAAELLAHARQCLDICRSAEAQAAAGTRGGGRASFPAVFAHKLAMHRLHADQTDAKAERGKPATAGARHREGTPGSGAMSTTLLSVSDVSQRSAALSATSDKRSRASTAASTAPHSPALSQHIAHTEPARAAPIRQEPSSVDPGRPVRDESCVDRHPEDKEAPEFKLGEEGRVYEFEAAARPVVCKAAFFEGLGWMHTLQDGAVWGQLHDGSQIVATESQVVAVTATGERIAVPVERGQLQDDQDDRLSARLRWSAQQVLDLRDVL